MSIDIKLKRVKNIMYMILYIIYNNNNVVIIIIYIIYDNNNM